MFTAVINILSVCIVIMGTKLKNAVLRKLYTEATAEHRASNWTHNVWLKQFIRINMPKCTTSSIIKIVSNKTVTDILFSSLFMYIYEKNCHII